MSFLKFHHGNSTLVVAVSATLTLVAFAFLVSVQAGSAGEAPLDFDHRVPHGGALQDLIEAASTFGVNGPSSAMTGANAPGSTGRILVDNHISTFSLYTGAAFDDALGFTTGPGLYRLTGVELIINTITDDGAISLAISEPTGTGYPGETLYELQSPPVLTGRVFFAAPDNAYLAPNSDYLVRFDITSGSASVQTTNSYDESDLGLPGWSIADFLWTSSGATQGLNWSSLTSNLYAITVRGTEKPDKFGESAGNSGRLDFSRYSGESPEVKGFINDSTDTDWFNTTLSFDYGGRYRIDVDPTGLTDDEDIGIRAFYVDYPNDHSRDIVVDLEAVSDPPDGYVSWHFVAGRNYGPYIEVYADNGTTGQYSIRVVYDPDKVWTGTEVVRGICRTTTPHGPRLQLTMRQQT